MDPVVCFRGTGATFPAPESDVRPFTTNASLAQALERLEFRPDVLFHAAALSDFVVDTIAGGSGRKLQSRAGEIQLTLRPAPKILPRLREWFPAASIVGWKYELDGDRESVRARGLEQISEADTDACVLNGAAYGTGFGLLTRDGQLEHFPDKATLAAELIARFAR